MNRAHLSVLMLVLTWAPAMAAHGAEKKASFTLTSSDGRVEATVATAKDGQPCWSLKREGATVIEPSALGVTVDGVELMQGAELKASGRGAQSETFSVAGVHAQGVNHYNMLTLAGTARNGTAFMIELRVFDDGFAWRARIPGQGLRTVGGEASSWTVPAHSTVWYFERPNAWKLKSYAGYYVKAPIEGFEKAAKEPVHGPPLVIELPDGGGYAALTEAALYDYSGMRLRAAGGRRFVADFTEGAEGFKVEGEIVTPWRVTIAARDLDALVNSDIIPALNPPPDPALFADRSWIRPGRAVWSWLAEAPQDRKSSVNYELQQKYVDYAAQLGFEYTLVDEGWPEWPDAWRKLGELSAYARGKGVRVLIWVRSTEISAPGEGYKQLREYLDQVRSAGVAGLKIDFINSEAKAAVDFEKAALTEAARRQLVVVFHGCHKPTGESRRFPNELSREGVRGMELNFMKEGPLTADHDAALPFTCYLAGHGDYTPVLLRKEYMGATTWAHQLAAAVALTSPLLVIAEHPQILMKNPAVGMLKSVPSTWDETRVLEGSRIGVLALLARRKGEAWFVAALGGTAAQKAVIDFSFLGEGAWQAEVFTDTPERPDALRQERRTVRKGDRMELDLNPGGGGVIRLTRSLRPDSH